jgi:uncharacterized protein involved in exopolysaccharide biosynthesis
MTGEAMNGRLDKGAGPSTLQDFLAIGFRRRGLMVTTFLGIFLAGVLIALLLPARYESEMKILVRRERADSVVSPTRDAAYQLRTFVTEEELESEAELLKSRDLLNKVVVTCGLHQSAVNSLWGAVWGGSEETNEQQRIAQAALGLERNLSVEPIGRTNLIRVSYKASEPQLAARVLNTLASLYLDKHLALRRVPGAFEFFNQQAKEYREALEKSEAKLAEFSRTEGVVAPALERELKVRRLAEFESESRQARAAMVETRERIRALEAQVGSLPSRQTTQVRMTDNPQLMQTLKSTLLQLELRRTELLAKYDATYRPVQEVEAQIAQAREAIGEAQKSPLLEETTDRDPAYEAVRAELTRAKTELAALEARSIALGGLVQAYRAETQKLDRKEILQQDLLRAARAQEENYLLYLRKQEEARISDALDRQRISNAVVAEAATVPLRPRSGRLLVIVLSGLFGSVASVLLAFAVDHWDPSFRTPEEVRSFLGSPVVAAIPKGGH